LLGRFNRAGGCPGNSSRFGPLLVPVKYFTAVPVHAVCCSPRHEFRWECSYCSAGLHTPFLPPSCPSAALQAALRKCPTLVSSSGGVLSATTNTWQESHCAAEPLVAFLLSNTLFHQGLHGLVSHLSREHRNSPKASYFKIMKYRVSVFNFYFSFYFNTLNIYNKY
jgi:hypothetical protein